MCRRKTVSFYLLAEQYNGAARIVYDEQKNERNYNSPALMLVAHAFELNLKAMGYLYCQNFDPHKFRHKIHKLYRYLIQFSCCQISLDDAAKSANNEIRKIARTLRDEDFAKVKSYLQLEEVDQSVYRQFGFPADEDIESFEVSFDETIRWYSEQVENDGNQLRYPKERMVRTHVLGGGASSVSENVDFLMLYYSNINLRRSLERQARQLAQ